VASSAPVAIVGAGVSGLACAIRLHEAGVPVRVFEAAPEVGGRVRSERVDGFTIDRGFQVLPTAYPEVQAMLDLAGLCVGRFTAGALVRHAGRFARLVDPTRSPWELPRTLASGVLPLADQLRLVSLRHHALRGSLEQLHARPEHTTLAWLRARGFSEASIERFFRPFFAGVFLERSLESSSRFFEFALRSFASGDATLPAEGMAAVPRQLAARLPPDAIRTRCPVEAIEAGRVLAGGARFEAAAVVVATDGETARRFVPELPEVRHNGTVCLSFAAERDPVGERLLVLDGEGTGPVNHLCVPSAVAPSYAPAGRALVSANVIGNPGASDAALERAARVQLAGWFGAEVHDWSLLRIERVERALPHQPVGWLEPVERELRFGERLFVCGDHRGLASLQGAFRTGRRAAEAVANTLGVAQGRLAS
jgi:phytoene dehydrogenase-like protein